MAIRKVIDIDADSTFKFEKKGQKVQGYYIGNKSVTTKHGPTLLHVFASDGGTIGVWGAKQLDSKLATIPKGALTFITYKGKIDVPNGTMHTYDVEYDDEELMDVSNTAMNLSSEPKEESETPDATAEAEEEQEAADVDPEEPEAEEEEEAEAAAPPAAPAKKGTPAPISQSTKDKAAAILQKARAASAAKA